MNLGRMLGLPVPVGFIVEKDGDPYYCSGNISLPSGEFLPADLAHFAEHKAEIACGTAVFDAWVVNSDRHGENIFYDADEGDVFLIDFGNALLGSCGIHYLKQHLDQLLIRVEFANELMDFSSFTDWQYKLFQIPENAILATCLEASSVGVDESEAREVAQILTSRRRVLWKLFHANESQFPKRENSLFSPFEYVNDDSIEFTI